jgi:hypothetical protein
MDAWALARFDGTALYEYEDPRLGVHQDWGTYIFNYGRAEVKSFLLASACYWLEEFHWTACAWMRWPPCSTWTTRASKANGCRTNMAAAKTWRPSTSCAR